MPRQDPKILFLVQHHQVISGRSKSIRILVSYIIKALNRNPLLKVWWIISHVTQSDKLCPQISYIIFYLLFLDCSLMMSLSCRKYKQFKFFLLYCISKVGYVKWNFETFSLRRGRSFRQITSSRNFPNRSLLGKLLFSPAMQKGKFPFYLLL